MDEIAFEFAAGDGYGLVLLFAIFGGFLAGIIRVKPETLELGRVHFLCLLSLIGLALSALGLTGLAYDWAAANGVFWLVLLVLISGFAISFFLMGLISAKRAKNAYSSKWYALSLFVPIWNLWLIFKAPRHTEMSRFETPPSYMRDSGAFFLIFGAFFLSFLVDFFVENAEIFLEVG